MGRFVEERERERFATRPAARAGGVLTTSACKEPLLLYRTEDADPFPPRRKRRHARR